MRSFVLACAITAACSLSGNGEFGGERYVALERAPTFTPAESRAAREGHAIKTVFIILMENHDWSDIKGSASAPFLNGLLTKGAHAEHYVENPSAIHPSEPNYIWLEAGDNLGIIDDGPPEANHRATRKHLTGLLDDAEISWKTYQEGIGGLDCPLAPQGLYDPKHCPMLYFDDITDSRSPTSQWCITHVRPYGELANDLQRDTVAAYNFITPDLCHDMHNGAGCATPDSIKNGDDWLAAEVPKILASAAYKRGAALFITWDESEVGENPIGMIVLSPFAKAGYENGIHYSHSSMLRTAQEILGVQPFLRDAANTPNLSDLFTTYP
jgi:phosphatidylinositol-3-phosphatase